MSIKHFKSSAKMSPEQFDSLANKIDKNLRRDLILVQEFYGDGQRDDNLWQRRKTKTFRILYLFCTIRLFIIASCCLFPDSETSQLLRKCCGDSLYAFGSFGCIANQIYFLGLLYVCNFLHSMERAENAGRLDVLSHITKLNRLNFTANDRKRFAKYLKWMRHQLSISSLISVPVCLFFTLAMYVTSLEVNSLMFLVILVLVNLIMNSVYCFGTIVACYALLITLHSSNYLSIRFQRLFQEIEKLYSCDRRFKARNQTVILKLQDWIERARQRISKRHWILDEAENVLKEVKLHNQIVKDILHSSVHYAVPAFGLFIVFCAAEGNVLLKHVFSVALILFGVPFYLTLHKLCQPYNLTSRLHRELHSMQTRLGFKSIKTHFQVLRLIQRTSDCKTWNHSIGFTVGNQDAFSPMTVFLSFTQTIVIAITFLNTKSSWKRY